MVENPGLLVARVFKLRYSRNGDMLEPTAKSGCSFVWRSIIGSKEVLELGSSWRVGNGEKVRVYSDRWVESSEVGLLHGKEGTRDDQRRARHLMNEAGEWDREVVESLFHSVEREAILNTDRKGVGTVDTRWWALDPKGTFTVKSCYLAQMGFFRKHAHTSAEDRKMWSRLVWQVTIPPKVRIFMWRACNNVIPTMGNLREQHVEVEGTCLMCCDRWATTEHVLFFCPKIRDIWKGSSFWYLLRGGEAAHFLDIATFMEKELEADDYAVWCIMVWRVWSYVCEQTYGDKDRCSRPRIEDSRGLWEAQQRARLAVSHEMRLGVSCGERRWRKPHAGVVRVDVDAMFNEPLNLFGVGVILRDDNGEVKAAMSKKTSRKANVMIAEVMAVVEGIILSIKAGVEIIEVFTDSLLVARIMASEEEMEDVLPDDVGDIIKKARDSMLVGVSHMYRSANRVAHLLAQKSSDYDTEMIWFDSFPSWLRVVASEDLSG